MKPITGSRCILITFSCTSVPGGTRPSHSHPLSPASPCSTGGSHSRRWRPLPAQCGTAGSGHSGPCSLETLRETRAPDEERGNIPLSECSCCSERARGTSQNSEDDAKSSEQSTVSFHYMYILFDYLTCDLCSLPELYCMLKQGLTTEYISWQKH